MAHEKALREAKKALDLGYSEKETEKLLNARGLDKDEIKKELPTIKAQHIVEEHEKAKKKAEAQKKSVPKTQTDAHPTKNKSSIWLWLFFLALIALIVYLFYADVLSIDMFKVRF